ncbi:PapD-like protein [Ramicandelaber brevisporus]|nr:PapD-like protein [Ramicandelaber brevisporus]
MPLTLTPPSQLVFGRPLTANQDVTLRLDNHGDVPVLFKVKTTAPKQYCVKPNQGRIEVGSHVAVHITWQALSEDPGAGFKVKDKFQVQSVDVTADLEALSTADVWATAASSGGDLMSQTKLKCVFANEDGSMPGGGSSSRRQSMNIQPGTAQSFASPPPVPPPALVTPAVATTTTNETGPSEGEATYHPQQQTSAAASESSSIVTAAPVPSVSSQATPARTTGSTSSFSSANQAAVSVTRPQQVFTEDSAPPATNSTAAITVNGTRSQQSPSNATAAAAVAAPAKDPHAAELLEANQTIEKLRNEVKNYKDEILGAKAALKKSDDLVKKLKETAAAAAAAVPSVASGASGAASRAGSGAQQQLALMEKELADGFSAQAVLIIALVAFFIAYFFF